MQDLALAFRSNASLIPAFAHSGERERKILSAQSHNVSPNPRTHSDVLSPSPLRGEGWGEGEGEKHPVVWFRPRGRFTLSPTLPRRGGGGQHIAVLARLAKFLAIARKDVLVPSPLMGRRRILTKHRFVPP